MNSKVYKSCSVPDCGNTSIKCPDKLFVYVPHKKIIRYKWLTIARRDTRGELPSNHLYFCEDHFDMPNDMANYMEYKVMGSVAQIRMKPGVFPTRFECQAHRRKGTDAAEDNFFIEKQRNNKMKEFETDSEGRMVFRKQVEFGEISPGSLVSQEHLIEDYIPEDSHDTADQSDNEKDITNFLSCEMSVSEMVLDTETVPITFSCDDDSEKPSEKVAGNSQKVAGTSQKVAGTSQKVSGTSRRVAGTSQRVARTSQKVAETSQKVSGTSQKVSGTSQRVAVISRRVAGTSQIVRQKRKRLVAKPMQLKTARRSQRDLDQEIIDQGMFRQLLCILVETAKKKGFSY